MAQGYKTGLIYQPIREYLAGRVRKAKGLTKYEKIEICRFLTGGFEIPIRKGRPSTTERDMQFAFYFILENMGANRVKLYEVARRHSIEAGACYHAKDRGILELKTNAQKILLDPNCSDSLEKIIPGLATATDEKKKAGMKQLLQLIEKHENLNK